MRDTPFNMDDLIFRGTPIFGTPHIEILDIYIEYHVEQVGSWETECAIVKTWGTFSDW